MGVGFPRLCAICGKRFIPTGRFQKVCVDCRSIHWSKRKNGNKT